MLINRLNAPPHANGARQRANKRPGAVTVVATMNQASILVPEDRGEALVFRTLSR